MFHFPIIDRNDNVYFNALDALTNQELTDRGWRITEERLTFLFQHQSPRLGTWTTIGEGPSVKDAVADAWTNWLDSRDAQDACFDDLESLQQFLDQNYFDEEAEMIVSRKLIALGKAIAERKDRVKEQVAA